MKNEKHFLYKKINEAMIIFTILFPVVGIFFVIMTIWALGEQAPSEIPLVVSVISLFFFVPPLLLHIYRKKVWLKKYMQNYKNSEG
ncbi:hypothetical protein CHCC14820_1175 [Bacillus paralicheniformis]|uniref:Uncharacterized protein n=1 Tax=Bacillus paralicheniformis TaxID=1648923 RepID=A0AAW6K6W0_9BACI|nr:MULTISPECIES: hypothetical protein [Bacillus]KUL17044.1 membrane protein [Bacillus licheniformis LMG 6934]MBG9881509.1 membrane protein [Bacillus paralicheniformis]MDE1385686.1 hypothetical protein [Bacillus paralicheniformis]MDE1451604.1 hypothetical protein [Bacillus paralicheniformis]MED0803630.1 hypothetical protein [Bacillus paralicheniformis]